jgi:D(-)-tartrate dehydratase
MRIKEIRETSVRLTGDVSNSLINFSEHTISLVAVISDQVRNGRPVVGIAFNSIGRYAQGGILRERFIPRVLNAAPDSLLDNTTGLFNVDNVYATMMKNEKPGGHGDRAAAGGGLELAFWDLNAKLADEPAHVTVARTFGREQTLTPLPVYAAGGYYYPTDSLSRLRDEIAGYADLGFVDFKIKIGGAALAQDLERIDAAIEIARGGRHIAVDANGRFDLATAQEYGKALESRDLRWYEEAGDPLDFALNAALASGYAGSLATGENLFSAVDVQNLVRFGGMRKDRDVFQMDAGLSYGLCEYRKIIDTLESNGFNREQVMPHGGHLINLHIAAALGLGGCEVYPDVFQPFGGYPPQCMVGAGVAMPTDAPGFGLEQKDNLNAVIQSLLQT